VNTSTLSWAAPGRTLNAQALARALRETRARTIGLIDAWARSDPALTTPCRPDLNLPRWELGHIGWFQEWWIDRNAQRARGPVCDPLHARKPSLMEGADALYDSSAIAHATRWQVQLPTLEATKNYLGAVLDRTLALLSQAEDSDDALYFWRLVLFHENMHNEAAVYMAQTLGIALPPALASGAGALSSLETGQPPAASPIEIAIPAQTWLLGSAEGGFSFDNELVAHPVALDAYRIDAAPVNWARYLDFATATDHLLPNPVRRHLGQWEQQRFGVWAPLDLEAPAVHVSLADANAWCRWAGRSLPTEAQWECAAVTRNDLAWGEVWEWTASVFEPFPGFVAHPYLDYSAPWFGSRQVLRGACTATAATMVSPRYRNFFTPERRDIFAGFRTVTTTRP
jgi:gamma-glutamyl hercynylcysteine S-oxide synthase